MRTSYIKPIGHFPLPSVVSTVLQNWYFHRFIYFHKNFIHQFHASNQSVTSPFHRLFPRYFHRFIKLQSSFFQDFLFYILWNKQVIYVIVFPIPKILPKNVFGRFWVNKYWFLTILVSLRGRFSEIKWSK